MKNIEEINVFTNGDSGKITTWSNIPFFFTETLLKKEIKINRVDLSPSPGLEKMFTRTAGRILKLFNRNTTYDYFRSLTHFVDVRIRIKKAIKIYPDSDANIFLTFSFSSAGMGKKPTVLFCDWTYDYHINHFLRRKPDFFEKQCIKREELQIERADLVFPLFPGVAGYMNNRYRNGNIYYLGNVINASYSASESDVIQHKKNSHNLLFVGSRKYIEGARSLIHAFEKLKPDYPLLNLHIIGMNTDDFAALPKDVHCYGYLDKGKDSDRELYYQLLQEAKIFVNTTPKWSAFSATIEAMYFYIPVIVSPYDEFVETFGRNIDFGCYCEQNSPVMIADKIASILSKTDYQALCINSHNSVKGFTWDAYIDKLLEKIQNR